MTIIMVFVAVMSGIAIWWLSHQRLASKPWLEVGLIEEARHAGGPPVPVAKIGLWIFISVVCAALAILISAFFMRIGRDWRPLPEPGLLWVNTGVLVVSSVALQWARLAARQGQMERLKTGLLVGGAAALGFLVGQLLVWRQLNAAGHFLAGNPAVAFFYLLTAVHGVHLLGGIVALGRTVAKLPGAKISGTKIWRSTSAAQLRLSAELCATYWHFLLVVWIFMLGLLLLTSRFVGFAQLLADFICGVSGG